MSFRQFLHLRVAPPKVPKLQLVRGEVLLAVKVGKGRGKNRLSFGEHSSVMLSVSLLHLSWRHDPSYLAGKGEELRIKKPRPSLLTYFTLGSIQK